MPDDNGEKTNELFTKFVDLMVEKVKAEKNITWDEAREFVADAYNNKQEPIYSKINNEVEKELK